MATSKKPDSIINSLEELRKMVDDDILAHIILTKEGKTKIVGIDIIEKIQINKNHPKEVKINYIG